MTDNFPPTNDIPPTGNSYGHYDEHYAALTLSVYVAELVKRGRKCADDLCADGLEDPAWALVHLADAVTAQAAKIAELGRERDDAKTEVRRIHREKCNLFDARVAANARAETLEAALREYVCHCEERECKSASINPRACGWKARAILSKHKEQK